MVLPTPPASPTPSQPSGPIVPDDQSSKQGAFLVGGIVVLGILALFVLGQVSSNDPVTATGSPIAVVESELATGQGDGASDEVEPGQASATTTNPEPSPATSESEPDASTSTTADDSNSGADSPTSVTIKGDWLPELNAGGLHTSTASDPAIGTFAPEIGGLDFATVPLMIQADGVPKVVVFIAHWCPHCQKEVPQIVQLAEAGLVPENVQIYAVSTAVDATRGNYPPQAWLEAEDWPFPVVQDSEALELFQAYGGTGFPFAVFLDGEHRVVARAVGSLDIAEMLEAWQLLAE